jgi:hypothetical protein
VPRSQCAGQAGADLGQGRAIACLDVKTLGMLAGKVKRLNDDRLKRAARIDDVRAIGGLTRGTEINVFWAVIEPIESLMLMS